MTHQHATLEDTVYLGFAVNDTSGSGNDGATPLFDVRLAGAAASAAPVLSGTPDLLTHVNYGPGLHEAAVAATAANGFAAGNTYLVFATITADSQTPGGFVGSFTLGPIIANVTELGGVVQSLTDLKDFADAGYDPATNKVNGVKLADTLTTYTGNTLQTGDVTTAIDDLANATDGLTALAALINALPAATDIVSAGAITTLAGAVANVDLVDVTTTNTDMVGTDGANTTAPDNAGIAAIQAKTDNLPIDPADQSLIITATDANLAAIAALDVVVDRVEADTQDIQTQIGTAGAGLTDLGGMSTAMKAEVNAEADTALTDYDGPTNTEMVARTLAAGPLAQLTQNLDNCYTGTASGTPTTTTLVSDISVTVNDQFNGRIITFDDNTTTTNLRGQSTDITGCTAASNTLTFTALTTAPVSGDTFTIT